VASKYQPEPLLFVASKYQPEPLPLWLANMSQNISTTKILDTPPDWEAWFFIVKSMATGGRTDVWKYIDPNLPAKLAIPKLEDPPNANNFATLSADDKENFKFSYQLWKDRTARTSKTKELLESIQNHITKTVSIRNIIYI
jgi:hypothetical protein